MSFAVTFSVSAVIVIMAFLGRGGIGTAAVLAFQKSPESEEFLLKSWAVSVMQNILSVIE